MYRTAREEAGLSREAASTHLYLSTRTLFDYETEATVPMPETVLSMSRLYNKPGMTQSYCRKSCPIGQAYSYEILNCINDDLPSVLISLEAEMDEAMSVMKSLRLAARNRNSRGDFTEEEWSEFKHCLGELMDIEHNIEILKVTLGHWFDVSELVEDHNNKCWERGYVVAG